MNDTFQESGQIFRNAAYFTQNVVKQVAQWAMIAHLGASIMFGKTMAGNSEIETVIRNKFKYMCNGSDRKNPIFAL